LAGAALPCEARTLQRLFDGAARGTKRAGEKFWHLRYSRCRRTNIGRTNDPAFLPVARRSARDRWHAGDAIGPTCAITICIC
jgi:hypothetical protein